LIFLSELLATGKIRSVLGKRFSLEEMVVAHKYVESGEKQGNVAISVGH
jgi:NADPH:quinone reductase-like Zn-dependent oxidoreductase